MRFVVKARMGSVHTLELRAVKQELRNAVYKNGSLTRRLATSTRRVNKNSSMLRKNTRQIDTLKLERAKALMTAARTDFKLAGYQGDTQALEDAAKRCTLECRAAMALLQSVRDTTPNNKYKELATMHRQIYMLMKGEGRVP